VRGSVSLGSGIRRSPARCDQDLGSPQQGTLRVANKQCPGPEGYDETWFGTPWQARGRRVRLEGLEKKTGKKDEGGLDRLRILVADGHGHRVDEVQRTVTELGHEVVGQASLGDVAAATAAVHADAAIVIVGESTEHALDLIGRIVTEAYCPVIAILDVEDEAFIRDAAKRGIFAYVTLGRDASALQSSLDVVLSRFAEYQGLEGAFARRAITERAKGILMERNSLDEKRAFEMLRDEARRSNRKVIEVAEAVTVSVNLLPKSQVD